MLFYPILYGLRDDETMTGSAIKRGLTNLLAIHTKFRSLIFCVSLILAQQEPHGELTNSDYNMTQRLFTKMFTACLFFYLLHTLRPVFEAIAAVLLLIRPVCPYDHYHYLLAIPTHH